MTERWGCLKLQTLWKHHLAFYVLVFANEKFKITTSTEFQGNALLLQSTHVHTHIPNRPLVRGGQEEGLCVTPFIFSSFRRTFRIPSAHSLLECRNVSTRGDWAPPVFQYCIPFRVEALFKFTTLGGISVVPSLSGYIGARLWWETEQVCQNNTAWKTAQTPEEEKKKMWQWRRGLYFFFLGWEFPPVKLL